MQCWECVAAKRIICLQHDFNQLHPKRESEGMVWMQQQQQGLQAVCMFQLSMCTLTRASTAPCVLH